MEEVVTAYRCEVCGKQYSLKEKQKVEYCEEICKQDLEHILTFIKDLKQGEYLKIRKNELLERGLTWGVYEKEDK